MRINIYVTEEQHLWLKSQPRGFMGEVIQKEMDKSYPVTRKQINESTASAEIKKEVNKLVGDGLVTCKKCGALLPYYKGKCKCGG